MAETRECPPLPPMHTKQAFFIPGERFCLWRYLPNFGMEAHLSRLYANLVREAGTLESLLWQQEGIPDRDTFHQYFTSPLSRPLWIVDDWQGKVPGVGCVFLDGIQTGHRAMVSMAMTSAYRGEGTEEVARLALPSIMETLDVPSVWTATPHYNAKTLLHRLGFVRVATLPEFLVRNGKPCDVEFWKITKGEVGAWERSFKTC
jgi:hypothetical protein